MNRCCFIIFAHSTNQTKPDLEDQITNIERFHSNCDFVVNHPTIDHPKVRTQHAPGALNHSNFIFGAFEKIIRALALEEISSFDHFCLVSANQYFINDIKFEKDVNYCQFYNTDNWDNTYNGYRTNKDHVGTPLQQPYGRWDPLDMYKVFDLKTPMVANWECLTLTKESMLLAKKHIDICINMYKDLDMMNVYPAYMALLSGQQWEFPKHFGTYDPSNRPEFNNILYPDQVDQKYREGYFSVKRVNYSRDCQIKEYIRKKYI